MRLLPLLLLVGQALGAIEFHTDRLAYEIGADGRNQAVRDRRTGKNYLLHPSAFMTVTKDGQRIASTGVSLEGERLRVTFGRSGVEAAVRVRSLPRYLTFELVAVSGAPVSLIELANLPLTLTQYVSQTLASGRDEEYAVAAIPLNIETHSTSGKGVLTVEADRRVRLIGATTHNPFFYVNSPLVSRSQVFQLEPIAPEHLCSLMRRALADSERGLGTHNTQADDEALMHLAVTADGGRLGGVVPAVVPGLPRRTRTGKTREDRRAISEEHPAVQSAEAGSG